MTGGSDDARPPKEGPGAIDDAWDALVNEAGSEEGAVHKRTVPLSGPHTAVGMDRLAEPDEEMERLMSGVFPKPLSGPFEAAVEVESAPASSEPSATPSEVRVPASAPASPEASSPAASSKPPAASGPVRAPASSEVSAEPSSRPSLHVVSGGSKTPPQRDTEPDRPARASRPLEPQAPAPFRPASGPPWAWIGVGVLGLGVAGYLVTRDGASPRPAPETSPVAVASAGPSAAPEPDRPEPAGDSADDAAADDAAAARAPDLGDAAKTPNPTPVTRSDDPREPPPGTPPEIAAVFRRLPVSPSDGPPVGGIGASGIHIDEMHVSSKVSGGTCSGRVDSFSVAATDRAGVCVRVVHPREKDELQVLWQKHGGATRRSKMVVLPKHAYRTRGYLKLRKEYIGDWTVRILSSDGVELARHDFTIVP